MAFPIRCSRSGLAGRDYHQVGSAGRSIVGRERRNVRHYLSSNRNDEVDGMRYEAFAMVEEV